MNEPASTTDRLVAASALLRAVWTDPDLPPRLRREVETTLALIDLATQDRTHRAAA